MKRWQKGSFTIEATILIPMVLLLVATSITILFYWHDRTVLKGVVYETAVLGAEGKEEETLEQYAKELIKGKLLWFSRVTVEVEKEKRYIKVKARGSHRQMEIKAQTTMAITSPEKTIRRKDYIDENVLQK